MAEPALSAATDGLRPALNTQVLFYPHVRMGKDGLAHLTLAVENVHCANCIGKIERTLANEPAVRAARVNLSTKRLTLAWSGDAAEADRLAHIVQDLGYPVYPFADSKPQDEQQKFLLLCLAVAGFASGNIMLLSFALWITDSTEMGMAMRSFMHWISALIALPTVLFSGRPFFRSALGALRHARTNMDVPISVGIILTTGISIFETLQHGEHAYFDSVVMLIFFLLIGRYLDYRARQRARTAASELLQMMAGTTLVLEDGKARAIAIRDIKPGMRLQVAMGERIPADGIIREGISSLDTSLISGETLPVEARPGIEVYSGMLNMGAPLVVEATKLADDSLLGEVVRLMEKAEQSQSAYVRVADRAARLYTPVVHTLAALTFIGWLWAGMAWQPALLIAATVLIITCPCALGLAVPVVQVVATGELMKRGVMIKSGDALERLAIIDTLLLDKTGTLTLGQPDLTGGTYNPADLQLAASLASHSRHPLSQAICRAYGGAVVPVAVTEHPGEGLEATADGRVIRMGSRSWCGVTAETSDDQLELWLAKEGAAPVRFTFADQLRSDAAETLAALRKNGLSLELLSGDRKGVVADIAARLGLQSAAMGELKPAEKYARLETLRKQGHRIGMVGDGLNDAPTLAHADVSISPATALDLVQNAADIVFMGRRLAPVLTALNAARRTQRLVKQNFAMAIVYNAIAIPAAMAGLVTPPIAALAMAGSSLLVIGNALRLKRGM